MTTESACPSCGAVTAAVVGPVHRYLDSSPGCWAAYGQVLEKEYSDFAYGKNHRLTVDAYALQHPGKPSSQTISSAAVHLASLCQILEHGMKPLESTEFMQNFVKHKECFTWLEPPENLGDVTVVDVLEVESSKQHLAQVEEWANATWLAWQQHHEQIETWIKEYG